MAFVATFREGILAFSTGALAGLAATFYIRRTVWLKAQEQGQAADDCIAKPQLYNMWRLPTHAGVSAVAHCPSRVQLLTADSQMV